MTTKTETYVHGMKDINYFYSMLYLAMSESMPGAQISQSGGFVWRGYQIDYYKELAYGQYGCEIYPDNQRYLLFQEGYLDDKRKSTEFEERYEIMKGRYYYPFRDELDLVRIRFFDLDKNEQLEIIKSFVAGAVEKALIWQNSKARKKVTQEKFQQGKKPRKIPVRVSSNYEWVGVEFLAAWEYQEELFKKLTEILEAFPDRQWVRPNANIYNFGFRGLRLKFNSSPVTSRWSIYFNDADRLKFHVPKGRRNSYNLVERGYFDLSADEQINQLSDFAQASIGLPA
jgi:hypothetical protein